MNSDSGDVNDLGDALLDEVERLAMRLFLESRVDGRIQPWFPQRIGAS